MKPLVSLFRETWWLWLSALIAVGCMIRYVSLFFLVLLPMLTVVYVYFSYMRFDSDGNPKDL